MAPVPIRRKWCRQRESNSPHHAKNLLWKRASADKAYLSRENMAHVVALGAEPYVPFKEGTGQGTLDPSDSRSKHSALWKRLYHAFQYDRERFLQHYHRRSNVESVFAMAKAKFGPSVRSTSPQAQKNEVLVKILCHNIVVLVGAIYEFGLEPALGPSKAALALPGGVL